MRRLLCGLAFLVVAASGLGQAPVGPKIKNLQVLPKDLSPAQVVATMRTIAVSLGVKCGFCHVPGAFDRDDKDTKKVARRMLRMVDTINKDNFDGRPEVTCYTCHRGQMRPLRQAPAAVAPTSP